jgi:hypothetical protein
LKRSWRKREFVSSEKTFCSNRRRWPFQRKTERQQKTLLFSLEQLFVSEYLWVWRITESEKLANVKQHKSRKHWQGLQTPLSEEHRCPEKEGMRRHWTCKPCFSMKRRQKNQPKQPQRKNHYFGRRLPQKQLPFQTCLFSFAFIWLIPPDIYACVKD